MSRISLRDKTEEFRRVQHQFARARSHRRRLEFERSLSDLEARVRNPTARQPTPSASPSTTIGPHSPDREQFEQSMRDLLVRVHGRTPPPQPHRIEPGPRNDDWWSPRPAFGYRVWELVGEQLHGVRTAWAKPEKLARCLNRRNAPRAIVPHRDGGCGSPPCGIYATKDAGSILEPIRATIEYAAPPVTVAAGVVALSGRVIEHEHGYRAERARVVALCLMTRRPDEWAEVTTIDDPGLLDAAFASPRRFACPEQTTSVPAGEATNRAFAFLKRFAEVAV